MIQLIVCEVLPSFSITQSCHFCTKLPFINFGFGIFTTDNNNVCLKCACKKDPQIINIINYICGSDNAEDRLKKYNIGLPKLRELISAKDFSGRKCPICEEYRVHVDFIDKKRDVCYNCNFINLGEGLFKINDKVFNFYKAKKVLKMKAFI